MDIKERVFSNYAMILGKQSDFIKIAKTLIRKKIITNILENKVYLNTTTECDYKKLKSIVIDFQPPGFGFVAVNWAESENNPCVTKTLVDAGFSFFYLGEDGSWLATPYYLLIHQDSLPEIKQLAQQGYFKEVKQGLWNL